MSKKDIPLGQNPDSKKTEESLPSSTSNWTLANIKSALANYPVVSKIDDLLDHPSITLSELKIEVASEYLAKRIFKSIADLFSVSEPCTEYQCLYVARLTIKKFPTFMIAEIDLLIEYMG